MSDLSVIRTGISRHIGTNHAVRERAQHAAGKRTHSRRGEVVPFRPTNRAVAILVRSGHMVHKTISVALCN